MYYSYLYATALAAVLWRTHFAADPLSREAGAYAAASTLFALSPCLPCVLPEGMRVRMDRWMCQLLPAPLGTFHEQGLQCSHVLLRAAMQHIVKALPPYPLTQSCCRPASGIALINAPRTGEHLRGSLLANGSAGDPRATLDAAVGSGHLHAVAGGWAPNARALLQDLQAAQ